MCAENILAEKRSLRKQILKMRDEMPFAVRSAKSKQILSTLSKTELYRKADRILFYIDYQSEVMTTPLITQALAQGKRIYLPKVTGNEMAFYRIDDIENLAEGYKGIREPMGGALFEENAAAALMIMPGAVFDKSRHRIGYGKGFYDRYLERMREKNIKIATVALCFECQMLDAVPYEIHDILPDMILTENNIYMEQKIKNQKI